ncbi:hypothetical protein [Cytobacillus sp. IB215316]
MRRKTSYVGNAGSNNVSVIVVKTHSLIATVPVFAEPTAIAFTPC